MDTILLSIGKNQARWIEQPFSEYEKRLSHYISFSNISLPDIRNSSNLSDAQRKAEEGKLILNFTNPSDYVVLLDEKGKEFTSMEFSAWMERQFVSSVKRLIFVIGGPYGFSDDVYKRANFKISLSKMTYTHEMVKLFFIEQLYRGIAIINHLPYHHN